jgi:hypothetical protein
MAGLKVTLDAAMRARDVSEPSAAQEAQAELDLLAVVSVGRAGSHARTSWPAGMSRPDRTSSPASGREASNQTGPLRTSRSHWSSPGCGAGPG